MDQALEVLVVGWSGDVSQYCPIQGNLLLNSLLCSLALSILAKKIQNVFGGAQILNFAQFVAENEAKCLPYVNLFPVLVFGSV